jgi:hypothetical protein
MSIPNQETIFGTIEFQGKTYDLLSQPLGDEQFEKINQYKKESNCGSIMSPFVKTNLDKFLIPFH